MRKAIGAALVIAAIDLALTMNGAPIVLADGDSHERIEGWGPFRFGMTKQEAQKAEPRAMDDGCTLGSPLARRCIEYVDTLLDEPIIVRARFAPNGTLDGVILTLDRLNSPSGEGACLRASKSIGTALLKEFGTTPQAQHRELTWYAVRGGNVQFTNLCVTNDTGIVVVSYEPSVGLR